MIKFSKNKTTIPYGNNAKFIVFKLMIVLLFATVVFCISQFLPSTTYADSNKTKEELTNDLGASVEEVLARLNVDLLEKFVASLPGDEQNFLSISGVKAAIKELTDGELF